MNKNKEAINRIIERQTQFEGRIGKLENTLEKLLELHTKHKQRFESIDLVLVNIDKTLKEQGQEIRDNHDKKVEKTWLDRILGR